MSTASRPVIVVSGQFDEDRRVDVHRLERKLGDPWDYLGNVQDSASLCLLGRDGTELARGPLQVDLILPPSLPGRQAERRGWVASDFNATVPDLDGGASLSIVREGVELWRAELPPR